MWYVLYTKPRNEKKTASLLAIKGFTVFCPTQINIKQWSDRKKKVEEPLFRSYLFVQLADYQKECVEVLTTPGAVRFLWWQKKPGIVRDEEIEAIKLFLRVYDKIETAAVTDLVQPGDQVTITSGPFVQKTGELIRIRGNKAYLKIAALGVQLIAEVPATAVAPKTV